MNIIFAHCHLNASFKQNNTFTRKKNQTRISAEIPPSIKSPLDRVSFSDVVSILLRIGRGPSHSRDSWNTLRNLFPLYPKHDSVFLLRILHSLFLGDNFSMSLVEKGSLLCRSFCHWKSIVVRVRLKNKTIVRYSGDSKQGNSRYIREFSLFPCLIRNLSKV